MTRLPEPVRMSGDPVRVGSSAVDDYYSPHPSVRLERPIVIAGQLGCGARMVGRVLSARTGLPYVEIDRQVEHEAGTTLGDLADRIGPKRVADRARDALERVALRRPCPVVVLDAAWPSSAATRLFQRRLALVYIQRPTSYLLPRIEKEIHRAGAWLLGGRPAVFRDRGDLAPLHADRAELLASAEILFDAEDQHPQRVAQDLRSALETTIGLQVP